MITGHDCFIKYGFPDDRESTPVNESTEFQKKFMGPLTMPSLITLAIPVIPSKIYCNVDLAPFLIKALTNVVERGLHEEIKTWDGCYNVRPIRAYEAIYKQLKEDNPEQALKYLSIHSWGIAIDINAAWNRLGQIPTMSLALVKCFEDAGFEWGGTWARKDGLHFQLKEFPTLAT